MRPQPRSPAREPVGQRPACIHDLPRADGSDADPYKYSSGRAIWPIPHARYAVRSFSTAMRVFGGAASMLPPTAPHGCNDFSWVSRASSGVAGTAQGWCVRACHLSTLQGAPISASMPCGHFITPNFSTARERYAVAQSTTETPPKN